MSSNNNECIAVFTARSPLRILKEGGSQAWVLEPNRVRTLPFLVCVQNQNNPDRDFSDASEPHGSVFLVGRISDVIPSSEDPNSGRWQIKIRECALIKSTENAWKKWRNPVKYTTLSEMRIDLDKLNFCSIEDALKLMDDSPARDAITSSPIPPMSISVAKTGLAAFYDVPLEAIEIVIRG